VIRPLSTRARRCGAQFVLGRVMDAEILEPCSLLCLSVSAATPGRHFAQGGGYREWARRSGRLGDIHSIDDRYDHDVDELMV
jgi:hypothetical protein